MTERSSNRPSKSEPWPKQYRKLTMQLEPSDRIFFRSVNARGIPAGVGAGNAGKACTVIIGQKEIEGLEKVRNFRGIEEFSVSSIETFPEDLVYSFVIDLKALLFLWKDRTKERMLPLSFVEKRKKQNQLMRWKAIDYLFDIFSF